MVDVLIDVLIDGPRPDTRDLQVTNANSQP